MLLLFIDFINDVFRVFNIEFEKDTLDLVFCFVITIDEYFLLVYFLEPILLCIKYILYTINT